MTAPDHYKLPFDPRFNAPEGAVIEYLGMAMWRYVDPLTKVETRFADWQANSSARDAGGMKGTHWKVAGVTADETNPWGGFLVTLEAAELG